MHWSDLVFHQGNEELQRFIELGILAAAMENPIHFHVEGVRGTGKTTLIRAARSRLPQLERIRGCLYNCRPGSAHCPEHRNMAGITEPEQVAMPFLEISHSAKVGTVAGSIDLGRLTSPDNPAAAMLPGTLPRAHRGIVFADEINRLADTSPPLVDVLLDAMGTKPGRVQIEETGLPTVELPLNVSVWAASNPDEEPGPLQEIRRQLADRFDFVVQISRPERADIVRAIISARQGKATADSRFPGLMAGYANTALDPRVEEFLAELYVRFNLESIRGVQAARHGALLHAVWLGKNCADFSDLAAVLPAALRHRMEQGRLIEALQSLKNAAQERQREEKRPAPTVQKQLRETRRPGHPSFWRGLWQQLSRQNNGGNGKDAAIQPDRDIEMEKAMEKKRRQSRQAWRRQTSCQNRGRPLHSQRRTASRHSAGSYTAPR